MVEADQHVGNEEAALRQTCALVGERHGRLEPRAMVVGKVADDGLAAGFRLCEVAKVGAAADERMPAQAAALDGFQQEGAAAVTAESQVGAEWCDEVDVGGDGHVES